MSTLMALAGWFLGLSLFVQVVQELYKQLTSSKSRAYSTALIDFAGPFAALLLEPDVAPDLTIRGPFQFRRLQPQGRLQPLEKASLIGAFERTQPTWFRLTQQALRFEEALQQKGPQRPSPTFLDFLRTLANGQEQVPGKYDAVEMKQFLARHGSCVVDAIEPRADELDAGRLLKEFQRRYAPQILKVDEHFDQLMRNFASVYRRRNLRQTFVLAFLLAVWFDFSFDAIYARAETVSRDEARAIAQTATRASDAAQPGAPAAPTAPKPTISYLPQPGLRAFGGRAVRAVRDLWLRQRTFDSVATAVLSSVPEQVHYLFGCLVTAVLICFGAPFWNDLTKSLLRVSQGDGKAAKEPEE
jgi:hypothetical protein